MEDKKNYYSDSNLYGKIPAIVGLVGILAGIAGYFVDSKHFFYSYLTSYIFWLTIVLGGLFFVMLHHLTGAVWSIVLRRISESVMMALPVMAILFIPVILGVHDLYHWSHADEVVKDELLQKKAGYLNITFFTIRAIVYFGIWNFLAWRLHKLSIKEDSEYKAQNVKKMKKISAPGMILFALSITFASFDWLMSLDPHWYSTIFGVYIYAGSFLSFMALLILLGLSLRKKNILSDTITVEHYHDIGKFLFGFVIFWGYMAFSQYFLIWYANIPEETIWYFHRWEGTWKILTMTLVFGHFLFPFIILMLRFVKRSFPTLKILAYWILLMHFVDMYWIVFPTLYEHGFHFSWIDVGTMMGIGGIFLWYFGSKYFKNAMVPVNDPKLQESINFVN